MLHPTVTAATPTSQDDSTEARVIEVVDGDTIKIEMQNVVITVEYIGVDAPELGEPLGLEALTRNQELVGEQTVRLGNDIQESDAQGRFLRYVYVEQTMVNAELLRQGLARAAVRAPNVKFQALFAQLEQEARELGRGIWGSTAPAPLANPCQLSPLAVPISLPPSPSASVTCRERTDARTGRRVAVDSFNTTRGSVAPGDRVTFSWQITGAPMAILELYTGAAIDRARDERATHVIPVRLFDNLPTSGSHTVTVPDDVQGGLRAVLWAAERGQTPLTPFARLAYAVLDLPPRN